MVHAISEDRLAHLFGTGGAHGPIVAPEFEAGRLEFQPDSAEQAAHLGFGVGHHLLIDHPGRSAGRSGIDHITRFDAAAFACRFAGEVKGFDIAQYIPAKEARHMDTFIHYGLAASIQAVQDAGLPSKDELSEEQAERIGVMVGSGIGGLPMIEETHAEFVNRGPRRISPFFVPASIINMIAGHVSMKFGFKGPNIAIVTACTTGLHCIGEGSRMIEYGDADVVVAGGSEATISPLGLGGFSVLRIKPAIIGEKVRALKVEMAMAKAIVRANWR